jgi:hypothetical protein
MASLMAAAAGWRNLPAGPGGGTLPYGPPENVAAGWGVLNCGEYSTSFHAVGIPDCHLEVENGTEF